MAFAGKIVIVTGAGGGIGSEICRVFSANGASVVAMDVNEATVQKTLTTLTGSPESHLGVTADVCSAKDLDAAADKILAKFKAPPSIAINCAGVLEYFDGLLNCSEERWDRTVNINLKGAFLVSKKFIGLMKEHKIGGCMINFSSTASAGSPGCPEYSAAKAGIEGFTKSVAKEVGPLGIRVNAIQPGAVDTGLAHGIGEERLQMVIGKTPLGRLGKPWEIAELCRYLASDGGAFVTGEIILISGGFRH